MTNCDSSQAAQKWLIGPFNNQITNYTEQNKCLQLGLETLIKKGKDWNIVEYNNCTGSTREYFTLKKVNEKFYNIISSDKQLIYNTIQKGGDHSLISYKNNNGNWQKIEISNNNENFIWLLTKETRKLLANIIKTRTSKQ